MNITSPSRSNDYLVLKLDDNLEVIDIEARATSGLAHQHALRVTDDGYRCRVVDPEDAGDILYLFDQVKQKREMGFIREFGHVPNGSRSGDGCRTIGKMIYPAFGGMLEGSEGDSDQGSQPESLQAPAPPTFPSSGFRPRPEKIMVYMKKNGVS